MNRYPFILIRIGLVFVFLYAGAEALIQPLNWVGFVPPWADKLISRELSLTMLSIFQIFLSLWLLSGFKERYSAWAASIFLVIVIIQNLGQMDILFRDVGLLFSSSALAFRDRNV